MKEPPSQELKRARITALLLAAMLVVALISFVYALIQQTETKRQEKIATQLQVELKQCKSEVAQLNKRQEDALKEAERQRAIAEQQIRMLKKK